ncbi:MAG TPA: branched-chain amino acid ABC transporter permease [Candidatus Dormibacteraeota bacterium]
MTQQVLNAIFIGSIYALFAVGYTLVFGVLDVLNLAHSAVFMLGAVITYSLVVLHGMPLLPAAVIAVLVCGLLGLLIEFVALRPLRRRNAPPISALISTIGLALIFVAIVEQATPGTFFSWLWQDGANSVRFPAGTVPDPTYHLAGLTIEGTKLGILVTTVVLMLVLGYVMRFTQVGRALRAVAENRRAATLLGINVDRIFASTLFVSSALGGLAGLLFGLAISDISPYIGRDQVELKGLAVIVLGGMGSIPGAVLGGYLLGLIEVFALVRFGGNVEAGVAFAALFLMLVIRPQGLFGARLRERL